MKEQTSIWVFLDNSEHPLGQFEAPVTFNLNTQKMTDGEHTLKVISKGTDGREGIRLIPFTVRNGPAITIEGLKEHATIDGTLPIMINAYSKGDQKKFLLDGLETPRSIPSWMWAFVLIFFGWAAYYTVSSFLTNLF